ncbi:30S ribosomal protein S7 [Candidatus Woesearchaeota archaeon]|nr:30S ribosomal protein S7 [Candidatus Woesearchaeota archaeon]
MVLAFNRWDVSKITVEDPGLKDYICLEPKIVPRTFGRNAGQRFYKSKTFIVERFMNHLFVPGHKGKKHKYTSGHNTGKSMTVYKLMLKTLELIEKRLNKNPIEVLVKAIENAAPRDEVITIEYGGARYPKAVEVAPQRRVDLAIRFMVQGAYAKSFDSKTKMFQALADEIINAYNGSNQSNAISKKIELERQADAAR